MTRQQRQIAIANRRTLIRVEAALAVLLAKSLRSFAPLRPLEADRRNALQDVRARLKAHAKPRGRKVNPTGDDVAINKLTNWQRNQWAHAGYKIDQISRYARLQRDGTELYRGEVIEAASQ